MRGKRVDMGRHGRMAAGGPHRNANVVVVVVVFVGACEAVAGGRPAKTQPSPRGLPWQPTRRPARDPGTRGSIDACVKASGMVWYPVPGPQVFHEPRSLRASLAPGRPPTPTRDGLQTLEPSWEPPPLRSPAARSRAIRVCCAVRVLAQYHVQSPSASMACLWLLPSPAAALTPRTQSTQALSLGTLHRISPFALPRVTVRETQRRRHWVVP
jgi:hypothetical protein